MHDNDDGFTLVELLVYIALFVVVVVIAGSFLINSLNAQTTVKNVAQATSEAQLAARSLKVGVENGASLLPEPPGETNVLRACTVSTGPSAVWQWQAWALIDDAIYTTRGGSAKTATPTKTWTLLVDNVTPAGPGARLFDTSSKGTAVAFTVSAEGGADVQINTSFTMRNKGASPTC